MKPTTKIILTVLVRIVSILVIVWLLLWGLGKWQGISPFANLFKPQPVHIDDTPILISEIRSIAELHTARLYCEVVVDSAVVSTADIAINTIRDALFFSPGIPGSFSRTKKIVLIARGRVTAGMDLSGLTKEDMVTRKDSVWVTLPQPRILEVISNPSDFEIFMEEGTWTSNEIALVKQKAVGQMQWEAQKRQLVEQAQYRAIALMEQFLKTSGFNFVNIQIK